MDKIKIVPVAPAKIAQLEMALEEAVDKGQITNEEGEKALGLIRELRIYGLTPYINSELGKILAKIEWEMEVEESPEWSAALIACDEAFLGAELKEMCFVKGMSTSGHKKLLCKKLYNAKEELVIDIMQPYLGGNK